MIAHAERVLAAMDDLADEQPYPLSAGQRWLLTHLAYIATEEGTVPVTQAREAHVLGYSYNSLHRWLTELEARGFLTKRGYGRWSLGDWFFR